MSTDVQPEPEQTHDGGDGRVAQRCAGAHPPVLHPRQVSDDLRTLTRRAGAAADEFYRDRWSHDKVVRSTHGVNCTGSCSWKVYVKDGIITWETQQTDYPSVGPDSPEYEPRGCPRGAAFSWYTYSPTRVRYPYVRGVLLQMYREAKAQHAATRSRRGRTSSTTRSAPGLQVGARQGRPGPRQLGRGDRDGRRRLRAHHQEVGPRPGGRVLADPGDVDGLPRGPAPGSPRSSAARCCRSTTGTPTCRSPRRRSSATRPTCRSPATGGTPAT